MSRQQSLQSPAAPAEQPHSRTHRVYTIAQICERIEMTRATFFRLRQSGQLPFLEEVQPRLGRIVRYRADLVERYLENRFRRHPAQSLRSSTSSGIPQIGQRS